MDEASSSVSLLGITVCITCLVLTACVAVEAARRGGEDAAAVADCA